MRRFFIYFLPLLCVLALVFVVRYFIMLDGSSGAHRTERASDLLIWADPGLRQALQSPDIEHESGVIGRFERRHGIRVQVEYGSPEDLIARLGSGERVDLLAFDDTGALRRAYDLGLVHEPVSMVSRVPIIMVRRGNPFEVESVPDLMASELRLGIAAPYSGRLGEITEGLFDKHGISFDSTESAPAFTGQSVTEVARAVEQNRVDAAIVWRDAGLLHARNTELIMIPSEDNLPAAVGLAIATDSANPEGARQLSRFLKGAASGEIFELYGFSEEVH